MKKLKLSNLKVNPERVLRNNELSNLRGGNGKGYHWCCECGTFSSDKIVSGDDANDKSHAYSLGTSLCSSVYGAPVYACDIDYKYEGKALECGQKKL